MPEESLDYRDPRLDLYRFGHGWRAIVYAPCAPNQLPELMSRAENGRDKVIRLAKITIDLQCEAAHQRSQRGAVLSSASQLKFRRWHSWRAFLAGIMLPAKTTRRQSALSVDQDLISAISRGGSSAKPTSGVGYGA